jgi:uncharacterized protein with PhoU and TrkA domain
MFALISLLVADGDYIGTPTGETVLHAGDALILYGRAEALEELDQRPAGKHGNYRHVEAVSEQQQVLRNQEEAEEK